MAKVLGFSIEIQGTSKAIDTTNQLKEALKQINKEMGNVSDQDLYNSMAKDAAKLQAELKAVNKEQQNLVREMEGAKAGKTSYVALNAELVRLRQNYKSMTEEERKSPLGKETIKSIGQLDKQLKAMDASMGNFQRNVGNYLNVATASFGNMIPGLSSITSLIGNIGAEASKSGKLIVGAFGIIGIIATAATALYQVNADIDEGMADLQKTSGLTRIEVTKLGEELKGLDTRTTLEDLLKIGAALGQLGVDVNKDTISAIDTLNVALGGELADSAEDVATKIGILRNLLKDSQTGDVADDYLRLGNALNVAGASGAATADVMQDISTRIASTGQTLGLTSGQILGFAKSLQEAGVNAEKAGTGMNRILTEIAKAPEQFANVLKLPVAEFKKQTEEDLAGAFVTVVKRVAELQKSGGDAIRILDALKISGDGERTVFLNLAGSIDQVQGNIDLMSQSLLTNASIAEENATKQDTLAGSWQRLSNTIQNSFIGRGISEFFSGAFNWLTSLIDRAEDANKSLGEAGQQIREDARTVIDLFERAKQGDAQAKAALSTQYKEYLGALDLQKASLKDIEEQQKKVDKAFSDKSWILTLKEELNSYNTQLSNTNKERDKWQKKEAEWRKGITNLSVRYSPEQTKKMADEFAKSAEKEGQKADQLKTKIAKLNAEILALQKGVGAALGTGKKSARLSELQADLDAGKNGGKKGKSATDLQKDADSASLKATDYFYKQLNKLQEEYIAAYNGAIEDQYDRERAIIQAQFDKKKADRVTLEADFEKLLRDEREKAVIAYGQNSQQVADIDEKQGVERLRFTEQLKQAELRAEEDRRLALLEVDKKVAKDKLDQRNQLMTAIENAAKQELDATNKLANEQVKNLESESKIQQDAVKKNEAAKLKIKEDYAQKIFKVEEKRIQDEIEILQSQVNLKAFEGVTDEQAKAQIDALNKQLEEMRKLRKIDSDKNVADTNAATADIEDERLKKAVRTMNIIKDVASSISNLIDELNRRQIEKMDEQINKHQEMLDSLQGEMANTTGAQRIELQRQIDAEKAALDTSTNQKKEAEKQAAKEHQRIALIQAIIDTAAAVISNLSTAPKPWMAIAAGVTGAIQTGIIASQAFAQGGKVLSGEKIRSRPNIRMSNGDNVLATVRTGEVVLNERQQAALGGARTFRRIGVPGFATGGVIGTPLPRPADYFMAAQTAGAPTNNEFNALIRSIDARFDRLQVHVVGEDVANELTNQARAKKAAVI